MIALEETARSEGRTLLTLGTVAGSNAEALYGSLDFIAVGVIPRYARSAQTQATAAEANLLANTKLSAPIKVGWLPRVDTMIGVEGKPRQTLESTEALISAAITGQARTIGPPTITASGASP